MRRTSVCAMALAAMIVGLGASGAQGAVACGAVGDVTEGQNGAYIYTVTVTWDFGGEALPDEINLVLPTLFDCEFYTPGNALEENYVMPLGGTSLAQPGCYDVAGAPSSTIAWIGTMRFFDEFCWIEGVHVRFANTGATVNCLPLSADTGVFSYGSFGAPLPSAVYYDALVIRAGDECIVCDYEGPLPDCNLWAPVEQTTWTTIKVLYR